MREVKFKVYTIEEHPNPEAVYEWVRNNWHDLGDPDVEDMVGSLKAAKDLLGGTLDYSISIVPDRGEYVRLTGFDRGGLATLYAERGEYPMTGCWSDYAVLEGLHNGSLEYEVLKALHMQGEYLYSDAGIRSHLIANEYEFTENGEFY